MELLVAVAVVAGLVGIYVWAQRSSAATRAAKAETLRELRGQRVTASVAARISIGRLRQVFELDMVVGEVVERHGQLRVLIEQVESVDVGRIFLGEERLLANDGLALDDLYRVSTADGQHHTW